MRIKTNANTGFYVWLIYFLMVLLLGILFGCNPVKKVLKDENKMREVWEAGVLKDWCKSDSAIEYLPGRIDTIRYPVLIERKSLDTTALKAAIKRALDSSDQEALTGMEMSYAAGYNDAIEAVRNQKVVQQAPDTIKVTKWDTDKEKLQQKEINKHLQEKNKLQEKLTATEKERDHFKAERNKWRLYFWLFLAVIVAVITRRFWLGAAGKLLGVAGKAIQLITKK